MNITIIDQNALIPVEKYGGTERVIWGLGKELNLAGHKVTYIVKDGSTCHFAHVIAYNALKSLRQQIPNHTDIIHLNHPVYEPLNFPSLTTIHGNPPPDQKLDLNSVFISKNHAIRYNSETYVYNGIDWGSYPKPNLKSPREYLHFLGKVNWKVKNVFGAAKIATKSRHNLHIMGGDKWTFRNIKRGLRYILNPTIIFHGMVENDTKIKIAQYSKALIFPVIWHEPFGLAIIESMYAGCAVFGTKNGSLEELITPEIGFTSNNLEEIVNKIKDFNYNPQKCHEYAVHYFNAKIMTEAYLKLYEKVLKGEKLNSKSPKYVEQENRISKFQ